MTIIALYSNKGGVGKTAAAVNLAYLAAESGASTLLCDLDAQGSSTFYFRVQPGIKRKARGLVKENKKVFDSIKATDYPSLDLLPADFSHRRLDIEYAERKKPTERLAKALEPLRSAYDYLILDCPPTINLLAENIFTTTDVLLAPIIPTPLSLLAHRQLLDFLDEHGYHAARVYAFFSMVDGRKRLHRDLIAEARHAYRHVLQTSISYLTHVEQMGVHRAPVGVFAGASPAAAAYRALWAEVRRLPNSPTLAG
ncbi:MAG: AAA family ATPase [Caldilinea sp.]|uniref:ParA family protein n=1 Tax=Caldilinea sp. TaxID=2293560 RepID=UPI002CD0016D|nr:AAA family ATPase [Caldilinea sp.]